MDIETFRAVINMILTDNAGQSPEAQTDAIVSGIKIAQRLSESMGKTQQPAKPRLVAPGKAAAAPRQPAKSMLVLPETEGAILIGEAPPVAGDDVPPAPGEVIEYWRPDELVGYLNKILPAEFEVTIPAIGKITLHRQVTRPNVLVPMGHRGPDPVVPVVHIQYGVLGDPEGVRTSVMITDPPKTVTADRILAEIEAGANALLSKEKRKLQPMVLQKPPGMPTARDFEQVRRSGGSANMVSNNELDALEYRPTLAEVSAGRQRYIDANPVKE